MFAIPNVPTYIHHNPDMDPFRAAYAYNDMQHDPEARHIGRYGVGNHQVSIKESYEMFIDTILWQWKWMIDAGLRVGFVDGEPYSSSMDMRSYVANYSHIRVRRTVGSDYDDRDGTEGRDEHPMFQSYYVDLSTELGDTGRIMANDIFRAVHDVFGHVRAQAGFGPDGEALAWLSHRQTMPPEALPALWCETRGQNAWTNFYGNHSAQPLSKRPFATQKFGAVPWSLV